MKNKKVIYLGIVGVQVLLTLDKGLIMVITIYIFFALDQERRVIQLAVVRNMLTLSVVIACTEIKFHMCAVFVKK